MIESLNPDQSIPLNQYKKSLSTSQDQLQLMAHELYNRQRCLVIVFEGSDAAGKGGAIKRLTQKLDSRGYEVYPIGAPQGEDRTHHYLWRFCRRLKPPEEKQIQIFDRSWYGRVLVERVEGFCTDAAWKRAYREINEFERQLVNSGIILAKFWLQISPEVQLQRFKERQNDPAKAWKLTDEDWRNRDKLPAYQKAVDEMLLRTSTVIAPWTVVQSNDKYYSRIKVIETVNHLLETELRIKLPQ